MKSLQENNIDLRLINGYFEGAEKWFNCKMANQIIMKMNLFVCWIYLYETCQIIPMESNILGGNLFFFSRNDSLKVNMQI